jgi:D-alanine-D-alanine ligase
MFILEINTIPGLTQESLIPKEASAVGMSFGRFLETIINAGMTRYRMKKASRKK